MTPSMAVLATIHYSVATATTSCKVSAATTLSLAKTEMTACSEVQGTTRSTEVRARILDAEAPAPIAFHLLKEPQTSIRPKATISSKEQSAICGLVTERSAF